ncbi:MULTISPECIES: phage tail protein [Tenacibaculum]|uniref:Glycerol acyltransferase n=1 Tax=Tenacibaculum discolor TaxID=361581 RepID=A0A2G1BU89_9FLAO|nr:MULTISPECIES: phage tail protein [Tenacibaculum]PHO00056.1 glycerol acyltransferase [Rhodobacteraceae bacterium 4F10]MDP2541579.1 phage tail protein [Tenacibaculum discolor]NVK07532.1 phage tail protein [Tenacibaculum sp.]PHN97409.1 glycerol acyltransferase [Tenacibaculum discolor]RLJ98773.1 phage tail-like protein [Tenacibaculum discolor]
MSYHPPVGFSFKVEFEDIPTSSGDNSFQSVSGLSVDLETEEIAEGGENRFKHKIPVRSKYPNLVLKRGMLVDSEVIKWCKKALVNFEIQPININVMLLGEDEQAIQTWNVKHAYPVKWNVGDFNAEESKLVIETLELTYNYFKIV